MGSSRREDELAVPQRIVQLRHTLAHSDVVRLHLPARLVSDPEKVCRLDDSRFSTVSRLNTPIETQNWVADGQFQRSGRCYASVAVRSRCTRLDAMCGSVPHEDVGRRSNQEAILRVSLACDDIGEAHFGDICLLPAYRLLVSQI